MLIQLKQCCLLSIYAAKIQSEFKTNLKLHNQIKSYGNVKLELDNESGFVKGVDLGSLGADHCYLPTDYPSLSSISCCQWSYAGDHSRWPDAAGGQDNPGHPQFMAGNTWSWHWSTHQGRPVLTQPIWQPHFILQYFFKIKNAILNGFGFIMFSWEIQYGKGFQLSLIRLGIVSKILEEDHELLTSDNVFCRSSPAIVDL